MQPFTLTTYPKSYASIQKEAYRLQNYLDRPEEEIELVEAALWKFVIERMQTVPAVREFQDLPFLNSGWEWSVFTRGQETVVKIPAGIFPEVETEEYLANSQYIYDEVLRFFPTHFVAQTEFFRRDDVNMQVQQYIEGKNNFYLGYNTKNRVLLQELISFLHSSLRMLEELEWLPDFDIRRVRGGFKLWNIVIEKKTSIPKIIDSTYYYDPFRLYPRRKTIQVEHKRETIQDLLAWVENRIA